MNNFFRVLLSLISSICIAGEPIKDYPEVGILSDRGIVHGDITGAFIISNDWITIKNRESLFCKWVNEKISLVELKKLIVFEDKDLSIMTDSKRSEYDEKSVYFKTCNYLYGYRQPLFNWGKDKNTLLNWPETDAYIDTEHSLLLIKYLDSNKEYARALFVDKRHQFHSNKTYQLSTWEYIQKLWFIFTLDSEGK